MLDLKLRDLFFASLLPALAACSGSNSNNNSNTIDGAGPCAGQADGTSCSDGDNCTSNDACQSGYCVGAAVTCGANTGCAVNTCDPTSGQCVAQTLDALCNTSLTGVALTGCAVSDYTVPVTVGNQTFQLTLDSGSSTLAVASFSCTTCDSNGTLSPKYQPNPSTATDTGKTTLANYGGGEGWTGEVYDDTVVVGSTSSLTMALVSINQETIQERGALPFFSPSYCTGVPVTNDDQGIFGTGGTLAGAPHADAYMVKLAATSTPPVFATQMCDMNGIVWFGGYDPTAFLGAPQYTPLDDANDYYVVTMNDMQLGGASLGLTPSAFGEETILDTGTSIIVMAPTAYNAVTQALVKNSKFKTIVGNDPNFFNIGECAVTTQSASQIDKALPRLQLVFPGKAGNSNVILDLPATESYLTPVFQQDGTVAYCAAITNWGDTKGAMTVIGNSAMHSHVVIFDRQNMQVGFAPQSGCQTIGG